MKLNYFSALCFLWAAIGLITRILMAALGKRWNQWEERAVYTKEKPGWLYVADFLALLLVAYTWYMVFYASVPGSWLAAMLLSLILVKVLLQMYHYEKFRAFVMKALADKRKLHKINLVVTYMSILCILLGIFYMRQAR